MTKDTTNSLSHTCWKCKYHLVELWWDEYRSPKRPVVLCEDSPAVGYYAGGRNISPESTERLSPDYIISSTSDKIAGYSELKKVNVGGVYCILRKKHD